MKSNPNFVCAMCGAEDMPGAVGSTLILPAGYGSLHDMERMAIPLCGQVLRQAVRGAYPVARGYSRKPMVALSST